jgi:hypothetical protein
VYSCSNWAGQGGIPAPGERALRDAGLLTYQIPDPEGAERAVYAGRHTLLVGSGASAATTALALVRLAAQAPGTRVTWALREAGNPYQPIENDPLVGRHALYSAAARLIDRGHPSLEVRAPVQIEAFERAAAGAIAVELAGPNGAERVEVDRVVANVGYQPDNSLYAELQVHECYASRGPMALAAALLTSGATASDCLAQTSQGPETLRNPEPGFYILGAKSYGKNSQFLIRVGLEQVRDVYRLIAGDATLDLYRH